MNVVVESIRAKPTGALVLPRSGMSLSMDSCPSEPVPLRKSRPDTWPPKSGGFVGIGGSLERQPTRQSKETSVKGILRVFEFRIDYLLSGTCPCLENMTGLASGLSVD